MTNIQHKETAHEAKPDLFAGIDVGAEELILVIRKNGKPFDPQKFTNTPADRIRLVKKLVSLVPNLRVGNPVVEARFYGCTVGSKRVERG